MSHLRQLGIPSLVRVKAGALDRLGIYLRRQALGGCAILFSHDLNTSLRDRLDAALSGENIRVMQSVPIDQASLELTVRLFRDLPAGVSAIVGMGGGKALDAAKHVAFLAGLPYVAVPTSLSNDGFASPQSSLTIDRRRRSVPSAMPAGVVVDTQVCLEAPRVLWLSGVGDLVAKFTAVKDWKMAFHARGTPVDDFAALLSDATVFQFIARPVHDLEGMKRLGMALLLNGIAMAVCGSSRPASGSEHLISHALDEITARPRLHGLQVGIASYIVSLLQGENTQHIAGLFAATGFWDAVAADPFSRGEWMEAARRAPDIKPDFYTVLSSRDCVPEIERIVRTDPLLAPCFVD